MRLRSIYGRQSTNRKSPTLGEAVARRRTPKQRSLSPHNRIEPHLAARCNRGDHGHCFSLHCTCGCHEVKR
jgi:hypothetical protein